MAKCLDDEIAAKERNLKRFNICEYHLFRLRPGEKIQRSDFRSK
jgi:hypothetical protein